MHCSIFINMIIASSIFLTDFTDTIDDKYSLDQSLSLAILIFLYKIF